MSKNFIMRKVLVLMAVHNGYTWLPNQIDSILNQSNIDVTLYISDDNSTDLSINYIKEKSLIDKQIVLLPEIARLGGACANFFRLITDANISDFDFIAFADQDDIWDCNKLYNAIISIQKEKMSAYSGNVTAFWPNGKKILIEKSQKQRQWDYMFESAGPGCSFVLTQKLALDLQVFLTKNQHKMQKVDLHDWFIYAFARSRGYTWHIDHESHMLYRQHDSNVFGANVGVKAKIARWKNLRSGWLINQATIIAEILNYDQSPPIKELKRYSILDRFYLILNINKLRRRFQDRIALLLLFLLPSS
jgi:rhamnosyltransferase